MDLIDEFNRVPDIGTKSKGIATQHETIQFFVVKSRYADHSRYRVVESYGVTKIVGGNVDDFGPPRYKVETWHSGWVLVETFRDWEVTDAKHAAETAHKILTAGPGEN